MAPGVAGDPKVYTSSKGTWAQNVFDARILVRMQNVSWMLSGTEGEKFADAAEIRERFGGIIYVGDSQIREIAWAGVQLMTRLTARAHFRLKAGLWAVGCGGLLRGR